MAQLHKRKGFCFHIIHEQVSNYQRRRSCGCSFIEIIII